MNGPQIFCNIMGQHDNLGDVVLRRRLLEVVRPSGDLHLLTGGASSDYVGALVQEGDTVYTDPVVWTAAAKASAARQKTFYFAKPGELIFSSTQLRKLLKERALHAAMRQSGGEAFVLGVGARTSPTFLQRAITRYALGRAKLIAWRDLRTMRDMRFGVLYPDWAFGYGAGPAPQERVRDRLILSMRVDRPMPEQAWIDAVRRFAERRQLRIVVVWQVERDRERSQALAAALGAELGPWIKDDFDATEAELRLLYRQARLVVSDRLHVLILAATEGAVPACLTMHKEEKIGRHFDAIELEGTAEHVEGLTSEQIQDRLAWHEARVGEVATAVGQARVKVRELEEQVVRTLR